MLGVQIEFAKRDVRTREVPREYTRISYIVNLLIFASVCVCVCIAPRGVGSFVSLQITGPDSRSRLATSPTVDRITRVSRCF